MRLFLVLLYNYLEVNAFKLSTYNYPLALRLAQILFFPLLALTLLFVFLVEYTQRLYKFYRIDDIQLTKGTLSIHIDIDFSLSIDTDLYSSRHISPSLFLSSTDMTISISSFNGSSLVGSSSSVRIEVWGEEGFTYLSEI